MIAFTYGVSGVLLALTGYLFSLGLFSAQTQTVCWMVVFFFASPAASAAYLTVSETFPLEVRALAIALFYAVGTGIGGVAGPALLGASSTPDRAAASLPATCSVRVDDRGGRDRVALCVAAERRSLKSIARPLAFVE